MATQTGMQKMLGVDRKLSNQICSYGGGAGTGRSEPGLMLGGFYLLHHTPPNGKRGLQCIQLASPCVHC